MDDLDPLFGSLSINHTLDPIRIGNPITATKQAAKETL
jgi:hypothetical protein